MLLPPIAAGFIAVLVGFTSAIAVLFQAASGIGASADQTSSLIAAVSFGAGITSLLFSYHYKKPLLMAFSTSGAAILAAGASHVSFNEMIGAFVVCGALITLAGLTGWFERVLNRIPTALASAMLAGVLLRFGLDVFAAMKTQPALVLGMSAVYLVMKRVSPRYAVIAVLALGLAASGLMNMLHFEVFVLKVSTPVFTMPTFTLATVMGVGIPLFVVTMTSQNLTGIAVMRAYGFTAPVSKIISGTGLATLLLAPFGAFGINYAAITAAIVMGPEAHRDPHKRYIGSVTAGILYILIAIFAATVASFFRALPAEFIMALAGIALFGTIASSVAVAVKEEESREAALITFLVTASGTSLFGIGSAFWGLVAGGISLLIINGWRPK